MAQDFRPRVSLAVIVLAAHPSPVQAGAHRTGGTNATPRHRHLSAEPTDVETIHPRAARQPRRETPRGPASRQWTSHRRPDRVPRHDRFGTEPSHGVQGDQRPGDGTLQQERGATVEEQVPN
jgi:hypothetical protein